MKNVTAFDGSPRKRHTHDAVKEFAACLEARGDVRCEIVRLADFQIGVCRGCQCCFDKGEEFCPLKDDRDVLFEKIMASDGIVLATPNYSFQVSGLMKLFLDRCGFLFHRPRFHRRTFTSIVAQGIYGGDKIVDYLDFAGMGLGFDVVKGVCCMTREPFTEKERRDQTKALDALSGRFHRRLYESPKHAPTLKELMVFRMSRTMIRSRLDETYLDYRYYEKQGWFDSEYYYPTQLSRGKRSAGRFFDWFFRTLPGPAGSHAG